VAYSSVSECTTSRQEYSARGTHTIQMDESTEALESKGARNNMDGLALFFGVILLYFALQLWILPKLGIST
jgi:hypothetical protein